MFVLSRCHDSSKVPRSQFADAARLRCDASDHLHGPILQTSMAREGDEDFHKNMLD